MMYTSEVKVWTGARGAYFLGGARGNKDVKFVKKLSARDLQKLRKYYSHCNEISDWMIKCKKLFMVGNCLGTKSKVGKRGNSFQ